MPPLPRSIAAPTSRLRAPGRRASALLFVLALALVTGVFAGRGAAQDGWRLDGLDGGSLDRGDVARGTTVLVVWAGWSPRCRDIVEKTNRIVERFGDRARVVMVDFQEEPAEVRAFLAGKGARAPVYLDADGSFSKQHGVANLPGLVVYRDGTVAHAGRLPDDPDGVIGSALER